MFEVLGVIAAILIVVGIGCLGFLYLLAKSMGMP